MILYYTGTGNGKYIADILKDELNDDIQNIVKYTRDNEKLEVKEDDRLIIISPVYFWGVPNSVLNFSKLVAGVKCRYKALILECGGNTGNAQNLFTKNAKVDAVFGMIATDNYCVMFKTKDGNHPDNIKNLDRMIVDTKVIAEKIKKEEKGDFNNVKGSFKTLSTFSMYKLYNLSGRKTKFEVSDDCIGCGMCAKNCNVKAIEMKDKKPTWVKPKCDMCLMCLSRCPKEAISIGKSKGNGRYLNPRVKF